MSMMIQANRKGGAVFVAILHARIDAMGLLDY